jgi:hypothetical protein
MQLVPALGNLVEAGIALYYSLCSLLEDVKLWNLHPFSVTVGLNIRVSIISSCLASDSAHSSPHLPIESRPAPCSSVSPMSPPSRRGSMWPRHGSPVAHRGFVRLMDSRYNTSLLDYWPACVHVNYVLFFLANQLFRLECSANSNACKYAYIITITPVPIGYAPPKLMVKASSTS